MKFRDYLLASLVAVVIPLILTLALMTFVTEQFTDDKVFAEEITVEETEAVKPTNFAVRRAIAEKGENERKEEDGQIDLPVGDLTELAVVEEEVPTTAEETVTPLYRCDGVVMDEDLQRFLYEQLELHGIEWFFPYAIAQSTQESECDPTNVTNGLDYGLYQYRITFWAEVSERYGYKDADIFNPYIQIDIYVHQMAKRLNEYGLDVYETISRHYTSDWGAFNAQYVQDVMERYQKLERIR